MPAATCQHPTCPAIIPRPGYCADHAPEGRAERRERDRYYDQHQRDPEARRFYNSSAWKRARGGKLAEQPWCERCQEAWAEHAHHRKPLKQCTPAERLDRDNLMSVCPPCHNAIEAEAANPA